MLILEDWRCDQHRWINQGVKKLPRKDPLLKKSYFQTITSTGPSNAFTRHAYQKVNESEVNGVILVHYMGDETVTEEFSHGNSKHNDHVHVRTCPSVLKRLDKK